MTMEDLTGKRFGKFTVVGLAPVSPRSWLCRCDCGTERVFQTYALKNKTRGCRICSPVRLRHGRAHTPEHNVWMSIKQRCSNPNNQDAARYSERGITLCARWHSFEAFFEDMGPRPTPEHTVERKNNNKGYSKENCRWATRHEQSRNTSANRPLTFNGRTMIVPDWAAELGISKSTIYMRLHKGFSAELALSKTPLPKFSKKEPFWRKEYL